MEKIFVRPATGIKLWDPKTKRMVPPEGIRVEKNQYWSRRLSEGGAIKFNPVMDRIKNEED